MVRMHLARAERAKSRHQEIDALRDAVYWARDDDELLRQVRPALGLALLAQTTAEGIATERDRERVREAAALLQAADLFDKAGDAFASIGAHVESVAAYRAGGLVGKLELALEKEQDERERGRAEHNDFADYDMYMRGGDRDSALVSLRKCIDVAQSSSDYRRRLDELESHLIASSKVELRNRNGRIMRLSAATEIFLGRDPLCDLTLRSGGISRRHARIGQAIAGDETVFTLSDAGSRNGTRLAGMPLESSLPLAGTGIFQLGDELDLHFTVRDNQLHLEVKKGLDSGANLWAASEGQAMSLAPLGTTATLTFRNGRPFLRKGTGPLTLNEEPLAHGDVQLIHGDRLVVDGIEIEVM